MLEGQTFQPNSPIGQFYALLPLLDYEDTCGAIEALIFKLDRIDGDPDLEADMSDYEPDADAMGDVAWPEWQTRGRHKLDQFGSEAGTPLPGRYFLTEDDEDDDADTGVEDSPFDGEEDRCEAGDDMMLAGPVRDRARWLDKQCLFRDIRRTDIGSEDDDESGADFLQPATNDN